MAGNTLSVTVVGGWQGLGSTRTEAKSGCYSKDSIDAGAKVKVVNESGTIVGIGSLRWKTAGSASGARVTITRENLGRFDQVCA